MKYIPQLYTGEMVCSIIAREKTVTRRPDKNGKPPCAVGDVIWVRETWQVVKGYMTSESWEMPHVRWFEITGWPKSIPDCLPPGHHLRYAADPWVEDERLGMDIPYPWRPSIHMPRWASRLNLLVTNVRLERVQDITAADALLEGVCSHIDKAWEHRRDQTMVDRFHLLWDSIYGGTKYSWANNAPVWRIAFEVMA